MVARVCETPESSCVILAAPAVCAEDLFVDTVVICCTVHLTLRTTRIPECVVKVMVQGKDGWTQKKGKWIEMLRFEFSQKRR
jgi:hypothetical protein